MRVFTRLPMHDWRETQQAARDAEAAGFDAVMTVELGHDVFAPLAVAALATERVELTPSVAVAFPRSPTVLASQAWDLQANSRGRFVLGLGSQVKGHNERRFGIAWTAPAPRLRDYVRALRAVWRCWETRGKLDFHSEHYTLTLMTPDFSPEPTGLPMVPVTIAAVGEAMLRVAGQVADGVRLHPLCSRRYLEEVCLPQIAIGMAARRTCARELRCAWRRVRRHRSGRGGGGRRHGGGAAAHRLLWLDAHLPADPGAARIAGPGPEAAPACRWKDVGTRWRRRCRMTSCASSPPAAPIARSPARSSSAMAARRTRSTWTSRRTRRSGLRRELIADIRRIPHRFTGFSHRLVAQHPSARGRLRALANGRDAPCRLARDANT